MHTTKGPDPSNEANNTECSSVCNLGSTVSGDSNSDTEFTYQSDSDRKRGTKEISATC